MQVREQIKQLSVNIEQVILGKEDVIEKVLIALLCKGHVLLEDVPGIGKTSLVAALAKSINGSFRRLQLTPDILPSDIVGFSLYNPDQGAFEYQEGVVFCNFLLADELNRTSPKTQASLLEVMEEGQVSIDGKTYTLPEPFMVLATQNPIDYLGTFPLPEAQLDRFLMRLEIGYPAEDVEVAILQAYKERSPLQAIEAVMDAKNIREMQQQVREVYIDTALQKWIVNLVRETREQEEVLLGVSPRGSLGLMRAAQGKAFIEGRGYVLPDDIVKMAPHVLAHRLLLKHEAKLKEVTAEKIILKLLDTMRLPKVPYYDKA